MSKAGDSTRGRIVEAARHLFWLSGYTVNQILERPTGASTTSFTKENVLFTVLRNDTRLFDPTTGNPIFEKIPDPIDRVFAILDVYRRGAVTARAKISAVRPLTEPVQSILK